MFAKHAEQEEKDVDTGADRKSQDEGPYSLINYKLEATSNKKNTDAIPFSRQVLLHARYLGEADTVHSHLSRPDLGLLVKPRRGTWCAHSD